jgi:predicted metalloendopeptidase
MKLHFIAAASAAVLLAACNKPAPAPVAEAPKAAEAAAAPAPKALVSGIDKANFDPVIKPQDDFFKAVNGGWLAKTQIPADKASYGSFDKVYDESQLNLRAIIEATAKASDNKAGSEAQKVGDLYASFMDEAKADELGFKPIEAELARIDAIKSKDELPALMAHLAEIGVTTPIAGYVHQDNKDSTQYVIDFAQSGLGLPDRDYYVNKDLKFAALRKAYAAYAGKSLGLIGVKDAEKAGEAQLALETKLAQNHWTNVETREAEKVYNKMTLAQLKALTPGFDWDAALAASGIKVSSVIVSEPSYLKGFAKVYKDTSLDAWKLYFKQFLVADFSKFMGKDFVNTRFDFYGKTLNGIPENRPRWKRGVQLVENGVGEALGKLYVEKHFPAANKARMEKLVANLLKAYDQELGTLDWMSADTKATAKAKLAKFVSKIGYPNVWRDYSALQINKDDLVGNVMRANAFEVHRNINKLGKPVDRGEWGMFPQTVNAQYNPEMNDITFPAAILQPPFFNMDADDAVNYGAIGAVIGHEISHGFDDQGSKYDGDGNLKDWWTKDDRAKFEAKSKALIAQYNAYEPVKGFHVNGALTIGENIADLGGMTIAIKAYHLSLDGKPAPEMDGMTGEQRVFMGYAQVWAEKTRDEALINQLKSDPHSPGEFRANGIVVNVPGFYTAFNVKEGDKMFKPEAQRISIW